MYSVWLFFVACILHLTSALDTELSERIVGGQFETDLSESPYVAFLIRIQGGGSIASACGATILSPKYVLTAAHCIKNCFCGEVDDTECTYCDEAYPEEFRLFTGSDVIYQNNKYASYIIKWYIHDKYKSFSQKEQCVLAHDIAVVQLKSDLIFSDYINSVKLPDPIAFDQVNDTMLPTTQSSQHDYECKVYGYGETVNRYRPRAYFQGKRLKSLKLLLVSNDHCVSYLSLAHKNLMTVNNLTNYGFCYNSQICTVDPKFESDTCIYDAGGPLICNGTQIGIICTGVNEDCVEKYHPTIYTRLDIYVRWINRILEDK